MVATFRYKYQAVKAFRQVSEFLKDDKKLKVFFLHDPLHGWYQLSNWFVVIFGSVPVPDMETMLKDALQAAKGVLVQLDDMQLHEMLQACNPVRQ
jgi:hypothetical protein